MRQGICWVLGLTLIVAGVGNPDSGISIASSAKKIGIDQVSQSNTVQPFVIVGEGIDNIIHVEPVPGGKLLAQTPLSYRLVDPLTGKMEQLPQGFPEGEITQWEEDYTVIRTIANQTKPVKYLYTIWPTMVRCITSKKYICFTDKSGAYASFEPEGDRKSGVLKSFDGNGKLLWDKSVEIKPSYGDSGFLRVFDGKLALSIASELNLMIFDLKNGESIVGGNVFYLNFDSYYGRKFAKPQKGGSFYVYENSLVKPKTERPSIDDPKFSPTVEGFEAAWTKDGDIKYSYCVGNDGHALYNCTTQGNSLPGMGSVMDVQNGVILASRYNSFSYFLEASTGKILETVDTSNAWQLWSFRHGNTICMVVNGNFNFFDTTARKIRNKFSLPMLSRAYGIDAFGYASMDKAGKRGYEIFDSRNPERKAFVGVPFYNASVTKRGIVTWGDRVKKGAILGHLHNYDGSMEPLAYADTVIDVYWMGEYKGEIYGLFGYWWWSDLRETMVAVAKLEDGKWVRKIKVADQVSVPFNYLVNDGRILTIKNGRISVVQLDEMKEYLYSIQEDMTNPYGYYAFNMMLLADCVVLSSSKGSDMRKPVHKCIIIDLQTGKTSIFDKFIGYCNDYVLGSNKDKYYKYEKGTLHEVGEVKFPTDSFSPFSCFGYKLTSEDSWSTSYDSRRCLAVKVWEQSNGWMQSIPVDAYQYTSVPPELYPSNGYFCVTAKPNPSWLPKMRKCASYKVGIKKSKNGELECEFEAQGADLLGRAWLVVYDESKEISFLDKPRELAVKAGQKTTLSFSSIEDSFDNPLALIVESNGFLNVSESYKDEEMKSELPLFAGMQAGPSGNNVVNAFFWEAPKGDAP